MRYRHGGENMTCLPPLWVSPESTGNLYPLDAGLRGEIATLNPPSNMGRAWAWYDGGAGL
jgi:hypothetical protein